MKVICFGDSNTFGYDPRSYLGERYASESRWVDILAEKTGWEIRNNGMSGREIPCREVVFSKTADLLIIMLGTNDLLQGNGADEIAARMERFLKSLSIDRKKILLLAPPPLRSGEWIKEQSLVDSSVSLANRYRVLAEKLGIRFADSGEWNILMSFDGVHFTEEGHRTFALKLHEYLCKSDIK